MPVLDFAEQAIPMTTAEVGTLLILHLISELHGCLEPSSEGCEVLGRARELLCQWETLGRVLVAPGTPFEASALPAIADFRALIDRSAPLLGRMRRPSMPLRPEPAANEAD